MKLLACIALLSSTAHADTLSLDPVMGAVGFTGKSLGDWSVSYERTLAPHHALVLEQTTVHVHDDPFHLTNFGLGVGYRYFLRERGSSPFVGGFVGAKYGTGRYEDHDLTAHAAYGTAHVGWRWVMKRFAITTRIGAGYAYYHVETSDHDHDVMAEDHLLPLEIDGELAIGWQF
jgi:hypothetical protein